MNPLKNLPALLLAALACCTCSLASAMTFPVCVDTAAELNETLDNWAKFGQDEDLYVIKIVKGNYAFTPVLFTYAATSNAGLRLQGGYDPGCATRTLFPSNTVLDGAGIGTSLLFKLRNGNLRVEGLTFRRYNSIKFEAEDFSPSEIFLKHLILKESSNGNDDSYRITATGGGTHVRLENLLIIGNQLANANLSTVVAVVEGGTATVANVTASANASTALYLVDYGGSLFRVTNSIFWGNQRDLLAIATSGSPNATATNIVGGTVSGFATQALIQTDPMFVNPGSNNYHLQAGSPAINSGNMAPPTGLSATDVGGSPRLVGSRVDRGAYESSVDDANLHVVTTTADSGLDSLRQAMTDANANGDFSKISFNIPGPCPQVIELQNEISPVWSSMSIDGYTQPGSVRNSDVDGWNGTLCVLVTRHLAHAVDHAFEVPNDNVSLAVSGLGFANFQNAAIVLNAGQDHVIAGNRIGAQGFYLGNATGIKVGGTASGSYIGQSSPESRNIIAGNVGAGVAILAGSATSVLGNLIGSNGVGTQSNLIGVDIVGSGANTICDNEIVANTNEGVHIGGANAQYNNICRNFIGIGRLDEIRPNGSHGVLIDTGAKNNFVGQPQAPGEGNYIRYNEGAGVRVFSGAGNGNRIVGNRIFQNDGIAIDLGALGPTLNDLLDIDSGANGLQNFPVIDSAERIVAEDKVTSTVRLNSSDGVTFQIDVYWKGSCDPWGRGEPYVHLGRFDLTTNGAGQAVGTFDAPLDLIEFYGRGYVSATATGPEGTSEIGPCTLEEPQSEVFKDGFEG